MDKPIACGVGDSFIMGVPQKITYLTDSILQLCRNRLTIQLKKLRFFYFENKK